MQAAKVLEIEQAQGYVNRPQLHERIVGNSRAIAVAKFREIADKLESGELDGARCQWLDTHGELLNADGAQISGLEFVTRTAWTEDGNGTVQLTATTIEEG